MEKVEKELKENKIEAAGMNVVEKELAFEIYNELHEQISELENHVCFEKDSKTPLITVSKKEVLQILMNYFFGEENDE